MGYPKQNIKWVAQVPSDDNKSKEVSRGPLTRHDQAHRVLPLLASSLEQEVSAS